MWVIFERCSYYFVIGIYAGKYGISVFSISLSDWLISLLMIAILKTLKVFRLANWIFFFWLIF